MITHVQITERNEDLRSIVELLEKGPATIHEIEMACFLGRNTRINYLKILERAGIAQRVPTFVVKKRCIAAVDSKTWELSLAHKKGWVRLEAVL